MLTREPDRVPAVARLGDDLVAFLLEEAADTLPNDFMVVGKEDTSGDQSPPGSTDDARPEEMKMSWWDSRSRGLGPGPAANRSARRPESPPGTRTAAPPQNSFICLSSRIRSRSCAAFSNSSSLAATFISFSRSAISRSREGASFAFGRRSRRLGSR